MNRLKNSNCKAHTTEFFLLGTTNTITAYGIQAEKALHAAQKRVAEIDDHMSAFKETSDIYKINANAGITPCKIHADTFTVLQSAKSFSASSGGAFSCTIRPLVNLWGIGKKQNFIPNNIQIQNLLPLINDTQLILDEKNCTAFLSKPNQQIDLGGIAKGYAADEVRRILTEHAVHNALLNLGGNIVTMGNDPCQSSWKIGIQNPLAIRGEYIGTINATNQSIVTSGTNEQFFIKDSIRYHHILNPKTGFPAETNLLSVTVLCKSSMIADALTTALFVLGTAQAEALLKTYQAEAIFVTENQDVFLTQGLTTIFERNFT